MATDSSGKFLIAKVHAGKTKAGKAVANLYSNDTRLVFPVLVLFDISMLSTVGIDPNEIAQPVYTRFWAYYNTSDKLRSSGKPYLDVLYLEPIDSPATSSPMDGDAILRELQAIKGILIGMAGSSATQAPDVPAPQRTPEPAAAPAPDNNRPERPKKAAPEMTEARAREEFYTIASQAVPAGQIGFDRVNELAERQANGTGWNAALAALTAELDNDQ